MLRDSVVPDTIGGVTGARAYVDGQTAQDRDFNDQMISHLPLVFAFVIITAFMLLLVTFRSIVVPIKAIVLNLMSVAAAYGAMVLVFQYGWFKGLLGFTETGPIVAWLPMFLFVVLFGLSMDYHVFILSRVKELVDKGEETEVAVSRAIKMTAGTVTSAAIVMVGVFALFGSLSFMIFKQMGVGLAFAVLLDATLVRGVLLPSTMKLLGRRNWWLPRSLGWLPTHRRAGSPAPRRPDASPRPDRRPQRCGRRSAFSRDQGAHHAVHPHPQAAGRPGRVDRRRRRPLPRRRDRSAVRRAPEGRRLVHDHRRALLHRRPRLATESLDMDLDGFDAGLAGKARLQVTSAAGDPVFVGIAPTQDVERYLAGTEHATLTHLDTSPFQATTETVPGDRAPADPATQDIWSASTSGTGTQSLEWDIEDGDWSAVVMNPDGSRGVDVRASAGADASFLQPLALGLLGGAAGADARRCGLVAMGSARTLRFRGRIRVRP